MSADLRSRATNVELFYFDSADGQFKPIQFVSGALPIVDVSTTLTGRVKNVTTAGTRVQLDNIPCKEVTIIAKKSNTGKIYVGGNDVSSTVYGVELSAGDRITLKISNSNLAYIDASVSGEGVSYIVT